MIKKPTKLLFFCFILTILINFHVLSQTESSDIDTINFYKSYFDDLSKYNSEVNELENAKSEGGFTFEYFGIPYIRLRGITFLSSSGKTELRLYQSEKHPDLILMKQYNYDPFEFPDIVISSERFLIAIQKSNSISIIDGNLKYDIERIEKILTLLP